MTEKIKFEVISSNDKNKWNEIVKSFANWDIYYVNEYAKSLEIHGDGSAYLIYFEYEESSRWCYVVMKKDIGEDCRFSQALAPGCFYDYETPYGYGGLLIEGDMTSEARAAFEEVMTSFAKENKVVSQFFRFHPLYRNDMLHKDMADSEVRYLKDTIYIDTTSEEIIMKNMDSKNRNMVRKAVKNDVTIFFDKGEHIEDFIKIYETTMEKNNATDYYYFKRDYYEYLIRNLQDNIIFFYAVYEERIIGASLFFFNEKFMHYHLSGVYTEYRSMAATNLLLYEAARWASCNGIGKLHLGGGIDAQDSLFGFKKQFNKEGRLPFYVGKTVFDKEAYQRLLALRKQQNDTFNENNGFMIQYRR